MFERVPSSKSRQAVACLSHQAPRLLVSAVWHWRSPLRVQSSSPSQRTRQVFPPESWLEKQSKQTEQCVGNRLAAITTEKRQAQLRWSDLSRAGLIQCVAWWSLVLDLFGFSVPLLSFGSVDKHRGLAWWDFHSLSLTLRRPRPGSQGVPIQLGADKPAAVIQTASRDTPHHTTRCSLLFATADTADHESGTTETSGSARQRGIGLPPVRSRGKGRTREPWPRWLDSAEGKGSGRVGVQFTRRPSPLIGGLSILQATTFHSR
jgi:hypothetical protein